MGMFDTFEVNNTIRCNCCNKDNTMESIQVKKFDCTLEYFEIGDIPDNKNSSSFVIEDYDWCQYCKEQIPLFLGFYKGIYVGAFKSKENAGTKIDQFDIFKFYKTTHTNRKLYQRKYECIKDDIDFIFEQHTTQPSNFFLKFHRDDILDFNIMTSIKNIINKYKSN